ncbi:MAG: MAE_28990/MAE_18760 family HEPN-like nuclease [Vicinamibacterales bacterium]
MRSTFEALATEIGELRAFVDSITPVNKALAGHHDSLVRHYLLIRRRFDYAAFIVALYASFETFLENLVEAYARLVAGRMLYSELPVKLAQKHMTKSAEILARGRLGEGRYVGVRDVDVVKNLHDCLTGASPYSLNGVAIVAHDMNLRHDEVNALFSVVGIDKICDRVRGADAMLSWYSSSQALIEPMSRGVPSATVEQRINDVVERRNQVAHRGGTPLELLGTDEMLDTVAFIASLSESIFTLVVAKYLETYHVASGHGMALQLREGPYKNGRVVVVNPPDRRVYVGQPIFAVMDSTGARWGRILSLQVDDAPLEAIEAASGVTSIGIGLDFIYPRGATLYALEADDDAVWQVAPASAEDGQRSDH